MFASRMLPLATRDDVGIVPYEYNIRFRYDVGADAFLAGDGTPLSSARLQERFCIIQRFGGTSPALRQGRICSAGGMKCREGERGRENDFTRL